MYRMFIAVGLALCAGLVSADGTADWKVYGFSAVKETVALFYLDSEIVRTPGHVQVWIKVLDEKKLEASHARGGKDDEVLQSTARLVAHYYMPPLGSVTKLSADQAMQITLFEQIADEGSITPKLRVLYEIDCAQKMARMLSVVSPKSGASDNVVQEWQHVPPESPLENLGKLTCKAATT